MPSSNAEQNLEPRRASLKILLFPALVAALALGVWWTTPSLGALPAYELEIVDPPSARQVLVGDGEQVARIELGASRELSVLLRPRGTSTAPVDARLFLQAPSAARGAPLTPLAALTERLSPAVLRVVLEGSALPEAGHLLVLVGRSGLLPDSPVGTASHGRDWQRFDLDFSAPAQPAL